MIYKKIIFILTMFTYLFVPALAVQKGIVEFDDKRIDYTVINADTLLQEADSYFDKYEETNEKKYVTTAMAKYYILTKIKPLDIYSTIQLARTYDATKKDRYAKKYFNIGLEINKNDPYTNYYYAEFYNSRCDYKRALRYYKKAYDSGYSELYDLNLKIATIYEKFADLSKAKYYYEKANSIKYSDNIKNKIVEIETLNYDKSEYYGSKNQ